MDDYSKVFRLDGKTALVTGAASGIGAAVAEALATSGAAVLLSDVDDQQGQAAASRIRKAGGSATFVHHDVTDEAQWVDCIKAAQAQFGKLDILVNNAGIETAALIARCKLEDFKALMDINVNGVFLGHKHAAPAMHPGSSIINLSSVAGLIGTTGHVAYHASKGAVRLITKAAAVEFGQLGLGIRVNSVHPGIVQTQMGTNFIQHAVDLGLMPDYATAETTFKAGHLLGFGQVADVASAVVYLASDAARWVTGAELIIDGGFTAQ